MYQQNEIWVQVSAPGERPMEVARAEASDLGQGTTGVLIDTGTRLISLGVGPDGGLAWVSDRR